jgi:hypothetical protein
MTHPDILAELARQRRAELLRIAERAHIARVAKAQGRTGRSWLEALHRRLRVLVRSIAPIPASRADRPVADQAFVDLRDAPGVHRDADTVDVHSDRRQTTAVAACSDHS